MPTGYTHIIEERDVTFNEFAKRCLRAMGATIDMREEPLDAPLRLPTSSLFHSTRVAELQQKLAAVQARTPAESAACARSDYEEKRRQYEESLAKYKTARERYLSLISQVRGWTRVKEPPAVVHPCISS